MPRVMNVRTIGAIALLSAVATVRPLAADASARPSLVSRSFAVGDAASTARPHATSASGIGSPNTVTADPPVARPAIAPCVVTLFRGQTFADFNAKPFTYEPPKACPGPWQKVVLVGDYSVSAGRQFDRTAEVSIANANVFYGTTPEPSKTLSPHWHFERDLTDETALLRSAHAGEADLGNVVDSTYTGIETGTVVLQFYPQTLKGVAPRTPDLVLPVPNVPGGAQTIATGASTLSQTYTLPRNVERAYLDVIAQSQSGDEFWYACVPTDLAAALQSCGNTAFRETDVTIDGRVAGIAPVYPWIYTGGIDPYLWRPIPGVQTLNFQPYRVDLTPFASVLADGKPHAIGIGVEGANGYFLATATLLAYVDRGATVVTGAVTRDTLSLAAPKVVENVSKTGGFVNGSFSVLAARDYTIAGYTNTPNGRVATTVAGKMSFSNVQNVINSATLSVQDISQNTIARTQTTTTGARATIVSDATYDYPLVANIALAISPNHYAQTTTIVQQLVRLDATTGRPAAAFGYTDNAVNATDTLDFDGTFNLLDHANQSSEQTYQAFGSDGTCYVRTIAAANDVLTRAAFGVCDRVGVARTARAMRAGEPIRSATPSPAATMP